MIQTTERTQRVLTSRVGHDIIAAVHMDGGTVTVVVEQQQFTTTKLTDALTSLRSMANEFHALAAKLEQYSR